MKEEAPLGIPLSMAASLRESVNFDAVEAWATLRIEKAKDILTDPTKDELDTALLRGEIAGYKSVLGLRAKVNQTLDGVKNI